MLSAVVPLVALLLTGPVTKGAKQRLVAVGIFHHSQSERRSLAHPAVGGGESIP